MHEDAQPVHGVDQAGQDCDRGDVAPFRAHRVEVVIRAHPRVDDDLLEPLVESEQGSLIPFSFLIGNQLHDPDAVPTVITFDASAYEGMKRGDPTTWGLAVEYATAIASARAKH